jgi:hypothetical protein
LIRLRLPCRGASMRPEQLRGNAAPLSQGDYQRISDARAMPIYRAGQDREIGGMRLAGIPD